MLKETIEKNINGNYEVASLEIGMSGLILKEFIAGNAKLSIADVNKILVTLNIKLDNSQGKRIETALVIKEEEKKDKLKYYAMYWITQKKFEVKHSTFCNYVNLLKNNIIPTLGEVKFNELNGNLLQFFIYKAQGEMNLSEKTTKDCLGIIKQIIADGQEIGIIPKFVYSRKKLKYKKQELIGNMKNTYTEEEYKKIINEILKKIDYKKLGILLGLYTGMRIGELCALQFKDIDFKDKIVRVTKTLQRTYDPTRDINPSEIKITSTKTENSNRSIPITNDIIKLLENMNTGSENYVLTGKSKFTEPRTFRRFYKNFMKKIGVEPLKFHSLRHTFASINIENGTDVKTISEILGHSDIDVTLKVYTHTSQKAKRKAIEKFEKLLEERSIKYDTKYKGYICCINKKTGKLDFIGDMKETAKYIGDSMCHVCNCINLIERDEVYSIIPKIEGITHKNGTYVGPIK